MPPLKTTSTRSGRFDEPGGKKLRRAMMRIADGWRVRWINRECHRVVVAVALAVKAGNMAQHAQGGRLPTDALHSLRPIPL